MCDLGITGMLGTVALDQQARLFNLHPASVHVCSICTRPAAQPSLPSLPQGQLTYLFYVCLIMLHRASTYV